MVGTHCDPACGSLNMANWKVEPSTRLASEYSEVGSYSQAVGNDKSNDLGSPGNGVNGKPVGRGITTRTVPSSWRGQTNS